MELVFHPATKLAVDQFISSPKQSLLIQAASGSGKSTLAKYTASQILGIPMNSIDHCSQVKMITLDNNDKEKNISIEQIRSINAFLKLKTTGKATYRRAVIIERAEAMSLDAQNAFLKTLEEPPEDTLILLTSDNPELLLPTIKSRIQSLQIVPPTKAEIINYYSTDYSQAEISKAYLLAEGAIGLIDALLKDQENHHLIRQIETAKQIYRSTVFERLNLIDDIVKEKELSNLLLALERVSHAALTNAINKQDKSIDGWTKRLQLIVESEELLKHNPNSKLLLSNLFINL